MIRLEDIYQVQYGFEIAYHHSNTLQPISSIEDIVTRGFISSDSLNEAKMLHASFQ